MAQSHQQNVAYDCLIKILTIGNGGVGKTSLINRFFDNDFNETLLGTIGIDFRFKFVDIEGAKVKLQVWDTAGQERFRAITNAYYKGADGILLVYDITDAKSFAEVKNWRENIERYANENVDIVLVGNKCDLPERRGVSYEDGQEDANKYEIPFFETSARAGTNVSEAFMHLAKVIKARLDKNPGLKSHESNSNVALSSAPAAEDANGRCLC